MDYIRSKALRPFALFAYLLLLFHPSIAAAELFGSPKENAERDIVINGRMDEMNTQLQQMTRTLEEMEHHLDTLSQRMDAMGKNSDSRLALIEKQSRVNTNSEKTAAAPIVVTPVQKKNTPIAKSVAPIKEQYNNAFLLLRQGHYDRARQAFQDFVHRHPKDDLASNAYYWLGETYYVQGQYKQASVYFLKGFERFPKGNKAPANLLKLSMALAKLGKKPTACASLQKLQQDFPDVEQGIRSNMNKELQRYNCAS